MEKILINFNSYTFRCSGLGNIMTEPKEKSPKVLIKELEDKKIELQSTYKLKISEAEVKRDEIKNKETKTYKTADERVSKLGQELETKLILISEEIANLKPLENKLFLSRTCISYLLKCYIQEKYGRRDELTNRYIKKGLQVEDKSIELLNDVDDIFPQYEKNKIRKFNEYIQGECDIDWEQLIIDMKSSFDLFTFLPKTVEGLDKDYELQGQGYLELWDKEEFWLIYTLINTPEGIISDECNRLLYRLGTNKKETQAYEDGCKEIVFNSTYDDIPKEERIIRLKITRNRETYAKIVERVKECRLWLNQYAKQEFIRVYGLEEYNKLNIEEIDTVEVIENVELPVALIEVTEEERIILPSEPKEVVVEAGFKPVELSLNVEIAPSQPIEEVVKKLKGDLATIILGKTTDEPEEIKDAVFELTPIQQAVIDIDKCQNVDEVRKLYLTVRLLFAEDNNLKDLITAKRDSFEKKPDETPVVKKEEKPVVKKDNTKVVLQAPVIEKKPEDLQETMLKRSLYSQTDAIKTKEEIQALYNKHKEMIDKDIPLRRHMEMTIDKIRKQV